MKTTKKEIKAIVKESVKKLNESKKSTPKKNVITVSELKTKVRTLVQEKLQEMKTRESLTMSSIKEGLYPESAIEEKKEDEEPVILTDKDNMAMEYVSALTGVSVSLKENAEKLVAKEVIPVRLLSEAQFGKVEKVLKEWSEKYDSSIVDHAKELSERISK
jgi:hypothetical protein